MLDEFGEGGESLREIERILDRYGEIGRAWKDWLDVGQCLREIEKKIKRDIDRLADFWKEWLDIERDWKDLG